ncbi:TetR family transcriptional regulator [Bosea sp. Root483D1]|uniref:TetR/AcrR family transcriptional regulator n=1 Tax=Bosea sp. Root483D1 TaxID=1736544 RepID=UPI00070F9329|nr:TetR/AcrR family transcriptional regulator [Bosea sp. Root483D1]KRE12500.1 TetR family transcriptional regulator [Bosea sp. Root483D1]
MPRVVKRPDDRRNEILDAAQALFFERGYERTTVNDVIAQIGISKGGFYHHFSAKEDLLEGITARLAQDAVARVRDLLEDPSLDALARLNGFLARSRQMKVEDAPKLRAAFDVVFRPENLVLYHRINAASIAVMRPVLTGIIAQGKTEGVFAVPDPEAAAEIILHLGASTHDAVARTIAATGTADEDAAIEALDQRLRFYGVAVDRILGLPDGSIPFVEPGFTRAVMTAR